VVLAGERPGGSKFSRDLGLAASVLVEVAGKSAIARVIECLESSASVDGGVLCGPVESVFLENPEFGRILGNSRFRWIAPESGPSASAVAAVRHLGRFPILLTAGDHALLSPQMVDDFCFGAKMTGCDIVFGVTPYALVKAAFPESKRTVSKFRNGQFCGTNLFALMTPEAIRGPEFWSQIESDRKRPWRVARRFGIGMLLRYLLGRLSLEDALATLAGTIGCTVGHVVINNPRVAVDVDTVEDRDLAEQILLADIDADC